jgi:hypothetical protein
MSYTYQRTVTSYNLQRRETSIVAPLGVAVATPTTIHNQLTGRDATGAHPAAAITENTAKNFVSLTQKGLIDTALQSETDPVFGASEAAMFEAGDKSKLDTALQSLPSHGNEAHDVAFVDAAGAAAAAPVQADDPALTDKRDPNDHDHTATGSGGTVAHSATTGRDSADSHPETAIGSSLVAVAVSAGAAVLTALTNVSYIRGELDCGGNAVDFSVAGFTKTTIVDVTITDGGLITYPVGWLWQTDDGDAPTPPTTGIIHIHLEGKPDAAGTGVQVWAWNLVERDDS